MKILLTFTGFHDPYAVGLIGQEEQPGPILSLVNAQAFDQIIQFSTLNAEKNAAATVKALRSLHPDLKVEVRDVPLTDPTDYVAILRGLRAHVGAIEPAESLPAVDVETALRQLGIVGDHLAMRKTLETAATLANSTAPILVLGETGTGKELFAKFIHQLSGRMLDRFVPLNCAAIPKDLVESILFGHKRGAFTGARNDQVGKFDQADGGTLFLDELAELPIPTQAKLLRVLQDGVVEPLGAKKPHKVKIRLIAATNQNVRKAIRQGRFREDLYYRLNVGEITLPSLHDRRSDIPKLALHVLDRVNATLKKSKRLSPDALRRLQQHSWPGNVWDLENVIERSMRLARQSKRSRQTAGNHAAGGARVLAEKRKRR